MSYSKNVILLSLEKKNDRKNRYLQILGDSWTPLLNALFCFVFLLGILVILEQSGLPPPPASNISVPVRSYYAVLASSVENDLVPSSFSANFYEWNVIKSSKTMETSSQHMGSLPVGPVCYFRLITDSKIQLDGLKKGSPS